MVSSFSMRTLTIRSSPKDSWANQIERDNDEFYDSIFDTFGGSTYVDDDQRFHSILVNHEDFGDDDVGKHLGFVCKDSMASTQQIGTSSGSVMVTGISGLARNYGGCMEITGGY